MKFKIISVFIFLAFFFSGQALAYGVETHAYLTEEALNLYNKNSKNKVPEEFSRYLIDGARREDDTPRWLNHFYDPVYNRALTADAAIDAWGIIIRALGNFATAKEWALSGERQSGFINKIFARINIAPLNIASILSAEEKRKISPLENEADFSWSRAIDLYATGEKEKAFFALGHIIHLLEDMAVPDHTRNDPHPDGSKYELYADRFTPSSGDPSLGKRLSTEKMVRKSTVDEYFDSLAVYSNNNFFSQGTFGIQSGYSLPRIDFENSRYDGSQAFYLKNDNIGEYKLAYTTRIGKLMTIEGALQITNSVASDYWTRLSPAAVTHGAGLIDLFIKEAEKRKSFIDSLSGNIPAITPDSVIQTIPESNPAPERQSQNNSSTTAINPVLSIDRLSVYPEGTITRLGSGFTPSARVRISTILPSGLIKEDLLTSSTSGLWRSAFKVSADAPSGIYIILAKDEPSGIISAARFEVMKKEDLPPEKDAEMEENKKSAISKDLRVLQPSGCSYSGRGPSQRNVVFNEIAWMGTTVSASDEWIELKNISSLEIDISGYSVVSADGDISVKINPGTRLLPGGFYLLERSDDDSVPNIKADGIFSGAIANSNESLRLLDAACGVVDEASASPSWPAGKSDSRKTMERKSDLSWQTSAIVNGTPKSANSSGEVSTQSQSLGNSGGGGGNIAPAICRNINDLPTGKIIINEIAWSGTDRSSSEEWIELYNPSEGEISLSGWQLVDASEDIVVNFSSSDKIPSRGFYLLERGSTDFITGVSANKFFTGSINNSNERLSLFSSGCVLSDIVKDVGTNWKNIGGTTGTEKRSAERVGDAWQTFVGDPINGIWGTPGRENSSRQAAAYSGYESESVVISEIMVGEPGAPDSEFIELHNPTNEPISIDGWSIRRRSGEGASEDHLVSRAGNILSGKIIRPKGFFLIASPEYSGGKTPDALYSGSSRLAYNGDVISLYGKDEDKIDEVFFGAISPGESWERLAFSGDRCVDPFEENEFSGNACGGISSNDAPLSLREMPNPQNSESLPEPRNRPMISFSADDVEFSFNPGRAEISVNYPSVENVIWKVSDDNGVIHSGPENFFQKRVSEVGVARTLSIRAKDFDGYAAETIIHKPVSIPPLNGFHLFDSSRIEYGFSTPTDGSFIEITFPDFPLFEEGLIYRSPYGMPEASRYLIVLYPGGRVPEDRFMSLLEFEEAGAVGVCYFSSLAGYGCFPHLSFPERLELPLLTKEGNDIAWDKYLSDGDKSLTFILENRFSEGDRLVVGYYGFTGSPPTPKEKFELIAADNNPIAWTNLPPPQSSPDAPANFSVAYSPSRGKVIGIIEDLTDADSPDIMLRSEWSEDLGDSWTATGRHFETDLDLAETKSVSVRVIDEFGLKSDIVSVEITAPSAPDGFGSHELFEKGHVGQSFSGVSSLSSISLRAAFLFETETISYLNIYDPSENLATAGILSRVFQSEENDVMGEYSWQAPEAVSLDPEKNYYLVINVGAPALFFGADSDSVPGNIIRDFNTWSEGVGELRDLWFKIE